MKTTIEPFKIKSVEPIRFTTAEQRAALIREAYYNPFFLKSEDVLIDFLTDSGTTAMSAKQWSGIMDGDEAYAGSRSYFRFEDAVRDLTGFKHIIPTHQGRAAEKILFSVVGGAGNIIPNNTHFDTTRANVEYSGAEAVDLLNEIGKKPEVIADFKGNMDVESLERLIQERGAEHIPLIMITVTNNSGGGQPVSMANIREVRRVCDRYNIPLFIDACRFAENAYFIKLREPEFAQKSVREIAREMFSYADGCTMSAKKDGMVNTGGFLAMNNDDWAAKSKNILIITEGFTTYGGLARRDLEAIAQGLEEVLDENYLNYRIRSTEYFGKKLTEAGVPLLLPTGGHAIYLDARRFAPHIPPEQFPGQAVVCEIYRIAGIRSVEIGSLMFGKTAENGQHIAPPMELVRLAIPRRVYTQSHIDYCIEAIVEAYEKRNDLRGMKLIYEAPYLRHFTAHLEYV
ncbi:tryptophanase [Ignavibacteria bacterium]|nr:tryptophanase [Bacteroidota bacterium]MCZ2133456.1 tryptophanase [Bacteroidota bacterium]